jgi:hypothetical protein
MEPQAQLDQEPQAQQALLGLTELQAQLVQELKAAQEPRAFLGVKDQREARALLVDKVLQEAREQQASKARLAVLGQLALLETNTQHLPPLH